MKRQPIFRWLIYLLGMILLATGLTLNTKTGLGVSAIMGIPYVVSVLWEINFGNATLVMYLLFIFAQMLLHCFLYSSRRTELISLLVRDGLQLPLSLLFTRLMNGIAAWIPAFTDIAPDRNGFNLFLRILVLLLAVVLTGIGASLTLSMQLVPNPGDGIVQALGEKVGWEHGFAKNVFDIGCVCLTTILSFVFAGKLVGVGVGTVVAMLGVGRVVALVNRFVMKKLCAAAGVA